MNSFVEVISPVAISVKQWTSLTVTLSGTSLRIYVNGSLTIEQDVNGFVPRNVPRSNCFIGASMYPGVSLPDASYDQVKIYDRRLTSEEVYYEFIGPTF